MATINTPVNVSVLYDNITRAPLRREVVPILVGRVQELLPAVDRDFLAGIDTAWADKVSQTFTGLINLCPLDLIISTLDAVRTAINGVTARRLRFNIARAMPIAYGARAFTLAAVMVSAAVEASQDPDMLAALTPPDVTAKTPAANATDVAIDTAVSATFSVDMDPTTFGTTSFLLANPAGSPVASTVGYDEETKVATLTPTSPLTHGVTYTARLRGGVTEPTIKDVQGTPLQADLTWSFTTVAS
jgi:hypothetical protein